MYRYRLLRMILALLAASLLALPDMLSPRGTTWADVGEVPEPGGLIAPGDKTDKVRMKSEEVIFSVRPDDGIFAQAEAAYYAHVTADFVMENLSAEAVPMDLFFPLHLSYLPAYSNPLLAEMKQAENVRVLVEGREVQLAYDELLLAPRVGAVVALFRVEFPALGETRIRVEYDVRAVNEPKSPSVSFWYMMRTGSHWAGTIGTGKVTFEFWLPVDSASAFSHVNDFFQAADGRLEWTFTDLEPTADHDITVTFEPAALEAWAARPSAVKEIRTSAQPARVPDAYWLRGGEDYSYGWWNPSPAYLLDTGGPERGWVTELAKEAGAPWLQIDLDQEHTLEGLLVRTGVRELDSIQDSVIEVYDTYRRPRTVVATLSDGTERTVSLEDRPAEWQMLPLPRIATSSVRLTFRDTYPGVGRGDAYLGIGRIQLVGVDAGSAGVLPAGACSGPNLLRNGNLEEGFGPLGTGLGWHPFDSGEGASYTFGADRWAPAIYQGTSSQLVIIASSASPALADRSAGIYQAISGLELGAGYELGLAGLLREEASHPDEDPYRYRVQWALAKGGTGWTQVADWHDVPWDTLYLRAEPGPFSTHTTRLFAPDGAAILFIRAWKKWATPDRELDVNLDAISLRRCLPEPMCLVWDLASDLGSHAVQENPKRDSYGNRAVWRFLRREEDRPENTRYQTLGYSTTRAFGAEGLEQWADFMRVGTELDMLPAVGINSTDQVQSYSTLSWPPHAVRVHPADVPVAVGWRSPISGRVRISGLIRDMDPNCGNGVLWSIDRGTNTLASGSLGNGESHDLATGEESSRLQSIAVSQWDLLYFTVAANGDFGCDSTELEIRIESATCSTFTGQP